MGEDRAQSVAGLPCQLLKEAVAVAVEIAEKCQMRRERLEMLGMLRHVLRGRHFGHEEPRHMQPVEPSERHQRVVRIGQTGREGHPGQQVTQIVEPPVGDRRKDQERVLRRHRAQPFSDLSNSSTKSISRLSSQ